MLKLDKISKTFSGKVLDNISFEILKGEIVCILGPNGCGKTTLLNIISGIEQPDSGSVIIKDNTKTSVRAALLFQNHQESLFPWKTVAQNIDFALATHNDDKLARRKRLLEILNCLKLKEHRHKYPYQLSGGLSQLTNFGRLLALQPDVLLLDEPFSALDHFTSLQLQKNFIMVWEEIKLPTVIVTHSVDEAILLADKIVILSRPPTGVIKIIKNDTPKPRRLDFLDDDYSISLKKEVLGHIRGFLV